MKKSILMLFTFLTPCCQTAFTQIKRPQLDSLLYNPIRKSFLVPLAIARECKSSFFSIIIQVRNSEVSDELYFSTNTPAPLRNEIEKQKALFRRTDWVKIVPEIGSKRNYNLFIPFTYFMEQNCDEKISAYDFSEIIKNAFAFEKDYSQATYILDPLVFSIIKPIQ